MSTKPARPSENIEHKKSYADRNSNTNETLTSIDRFRLIPHSDTLIHGGFSETSECDDPRPVRCVQRRQGRHVHVEVGAARRGQQPPVRAPRAALGAAGRGHRPGYLTVVPDRD